jgi:hypothetical protein
MDCDYQVMLRQIEVAEGIIQRVRKYMKSILPDGVEVVAYGLGTGDDIDVTVAVPKP